MKNKYVKPTVSVELFCPAQSIARDCADSIPRSQLTYADINQCKWDLGGGASIFMVPEPCTMNGEQYGVACYNNPSESMLIFHS